MRYAPPAPAPAESLPKCKIFLSVGADTADVLRVFLFLQIARAQSPLLIRRLLPLFDSGGTTRREDQDCRPVTHPFQIESH